jgi:tetratricopeptide (TPR) repeat protein
MPRQKSTHVDSPEAVGRRLKAAREDAGLSQRQLAFPGCSPAYISRIESGDRIPSLQLLRVLGERLDVSEDYLATGAQHVPGGPAGALLEAEVALRLDELDDAERMYTEALEKSTGKQARAAALAGLGQLAYRQGDPRLSIRRLEEGLAAYRSDAPERAANEETLGRAYAMVGQLDRAIDLFEGGLERSERKDDVIERIHFSVLLAHALVDSGEFARAEALLSQALGLAKDSRDPLMRAKLYWSQSKLYMEKEESERAARYARRALEILRLSEDTRQTARAHQLLAHIELDRRRPEEALGLLEEGWPLIEQAGNAVEKAHYRIEQARALAQLDRKEEAAALALQMTGVLADALPEDAARAYTLAAEVFADLDEHERALELYELAIEMLERKPPNRYLIEVYTKLADLLELTGRKDDAFDVMRKALEIQRVALRA